MNSQNRSHSTLTKAQLLALARSSGIEASEKMKKSELSELVDQLRRRSIRLGRKLHDISSGKPGDSWFSTLEEVIQRSIKILAERMGSNYYVTGIRVLESVIFAKCLTTIGREWMEKGRRLPPQLSLFSEPVGLISFQVHERKYMCIKYPFKEEDVSFTEEELRKFYSIINSLSKRYSAATTVLEEKPTTPELLAHLFDHLMEEIRSGPIEGSGNGSSIDFDENRIHSVHPARRSAIKDWQERLESLYVEEYEHEEDGNRFYAYPAVDVLIPDGIHLILSIVSPLDYNFVDEKVGVGHRCSEICLAVYDVGKVLYPGAAEELIPQIKQAVARVLFISMHEEATRALTSSFSDQSAILRHWVNLASKGYKGIVGDQLSNEPFNGVKFCKEVAQKVLCAEIQDVASEIYPFDRVFIFKESGATNELGKDEPIEMYVLESSILSNNPADRSQYLTRRDRQLRGTLDYECDNSKKLIKESNVYKFYIHGHPKYLILSKKSVLSKEEYLDISRGMPSSYSSGNPETRPYLMPISDDEQYEGFSLILYNLLGRLIPGNYQTKLIRDPAGEKDILYQTETFTEEFERSRLKVTERYDDNGLLFHYEHGINMTSDVPLLNQLLVSYFHYLDLANKDIDDQFRREALRQDNLNEDQISTLIERYSLRRKLDRDTEINPDIANLTKSISSRKAAKVVYISYSWLLNDENMQRTFTKIGNGSKDSAQRSLLGSEYSYTMILVADQDPEKSLAQLVAERENLNLFFRLVMQRIWIDRLTEQGYLEKKSQTISDSLGQFLHRAKLLIPDRKGREEIQSLYDNLQRLMQPTIVTPKKESITGYADVFNMFLDLSSEHVSEPNSITSKLDELVRQWFPTLSVEEELIDIDVLPSNLPKLEVRWPKAVIMDAFYVILKNACEAALADNGYDKKKFVRVQLQAIPSNSDSKQQIWFVDTVIENPGGPIPPEILSLLNSPNPNPLKRNPQKEGSTGVGVFLARYQLQNVIGYGCDILFTNLENGIVQTRLRLPGVLVEDTRSDTISQESGLYARSIEGDYVLYVEDNPENYEEAVSKMQLALDYYGVPLFHRRGLAGALELVQSRLPKMIFSDLFISKNEADGGASSLAWGISLIQGILECAKRQGEFPPLWVLTAEDEPEVRKHLGDITGYGYRYIPSIITDPKELSTTATICIFSQEKRPDLISQFLPVLHEIFDTRLTSGQLGVYSATEEINKEEIPVFINSLALKSPEFEVLSNLFMDIQSRKQDGIVIVRGHCNTIDDIGANLNKWFGHPGIPIIDPLLPSFGTNYRLTNHVWHKDLLLVLSVTQDIFETLPIQFLYWGLSRNLIFEKRFIKDQDIARMWRVIRQEDRGPLSQMRHDIKNELSTLNLEARLMNLVEILYSCEQSVLLPNNLRQSLEGFTTGEQGALRSLTELLKESPDVEEDRKKFRQSLQFLDSKLLELISIDRSIKPRVDLHRSMLHSLDDYLGGS
jgi:hypothetical protein